MILKRFPKDRVVYAVFMVFSFPKTLVRILAKNLVKNLAGLFGPFRAFKGLYNSFTKAVLDLFS